MDVGVLPSYFLKVLMIASETLTNVCLHFQSEHTTIFLLERAILFGHPTIALLLKCGEGGNA